MADDSQQAKEGRTGSGIRLRIRHLFKRLLAPLTIRIRSGPLQGRRWSPMSGTRFLRGNFKSEKSEAMARELGEGDVVYDVGAHVGYTAILASGRVGATGLVVAFEPRGLNLRFLRIHMKVNRTENIRVVESAVGERTGRALFDEDRGSGTGRLAEDGRLSVPLVSLDDLVASGELPPPDFIKVDVEGGELVVLQGARSILDRHHPALFLATHGVEVHDACTAILTEAGYEWTVLSEGERPGEVELLARVAGAHDGRSSGKRNQSTM